MVIYNFQTTLLKLVCQEMRVARNRAILFSDRGGIGSQRLSNFCLLLFFFVCMNFHTQKPNQPYAHYLLLQTLNDNSPQAHHELTCYPNRKWDEGEGADQDKNRGGVC